MNWLFARGGLRGGAVVLGAAMLVLAFAASAPAHVLSKTRAKNAARTAAASLATRRAGDATQPRFSGPSCSRRSRHRFVCSTTITGTASCDPSETSCGAAVPWELSYLITVKFRSTSSNALSVTTTEA